jgi:hypothetical protein
MLNVRLGYDAALGRATQITEWTRPLFAASISVQKTAVGGGTSVTHGLPRPGPGN